MDDGRPYRLGLFLGSDIGQAEVEGCPEGWLLAILDSRGSIEGSSLGWDEGCDLGQSKTKGCEEG